MIIYSKLAINLRQPVLFYALDKSLDPVDTCKCLITKQTMLSTG